MFEPDDRIDRVSLCQGDLLQRTDALLSAIRGAHPYYAEADSYEFFSVLTQSCDLVRRGKKSCKARYITIAAVRPLEILVDRMIARYAINDANLPVPVYSKDQEVIVRNSLERIMHNTEDGVFFLKKESHPALKKHYCIFLPLTIALRTEHYEACIGAKIAQLADIFQAKLGWLAGNLYSRVGTPDEEGDHESNRRSFLDDVLYSRSLWVTTNQQAELIDKARSAPPKSAEDLAALVTSLKDDAQTVASRIINTILPQFVKNPEDLITIENRIVSDRTIRRVLRR